MPVWINGKADLIIVDKDHRIHVIDYKSDVNPGLTEEQFRELIQKRYGGQMEMYRHVCGKLFGVSEENVSGSLTEIAGELHYDLCWLSREIKRQTGKTYKELLQEKRLTQAAYYLKHTGLHVDEIGDAVGYSNLNYFHRIFQARYGMTPKKYRDT